MMRSSKIAIIIVSLAIFCTPIIAQAGWFTDVYIGNSSTGDATLEVEAPFFSQEQDVNFDSTAIFGARVGYWLDQAPFMGIAADLSGVNREVETLDFSGTFLSPLLMFRFKISPSEIYPHGRFQPYIAFGPSIVFSQFDAEAGDLFAGVPNSLQNSEDIFSAQSTDPGFDSRLGFRYHFAWNYSLFAEYRFTYVKAGYNDTISGFSIDVDAKLQTHHFLLGIGWGF